MTTEEIFPHCGNPTFCGWQTGPKKNQCFYAGKCQWKNKTHWLQTKDKYNSSVLHETEQTT